MNNISLHPISIRVWPVIVLISFVATGCSFFPTEVRHEKMTRHYSISPNGEADAYTTADVSAESYSVGPDETLTSQYSTGRNGDAEVYSQAAHPGDSYSVGPHDALTEHYILKEGPYAAAEAPPESHGMAPSGAAGSEGGVEGAGATTIVIEASDVLFDFDKYVIKKIYYPVLDEWVLFFRENPRITAEIYGHTDSIGTDAYNQKLSERRARAVFNYLVENGIDPGRLKTRGFGENLPVAPNTTPEGRQKNRRVELNF